MSDSAVEEGATRAEVCAAAVADAFAEDGEIFASPMGTMPMLGVRLAKLTSNPELVISDPSQSDRARTRNRVARLTQVASSTTAAPPKINSMYS